MNDGKNVTVKYNLIILNSFNMYLVNRSKFLIPWRLEVQVDEVISIASKGIQVLGVNQQDSMKKHYIQQSNC